MVDSCQTSSLLLAAGEGPPRDALGNPWLVIEDAEELAPFLMSLVSDSDLWMYVSSAHALTCGRCEAERCLFPYETDDRLHRAGGQVGPWTALWVTQADGAAVLWRPFGPGRGGALEARSPLRLYKSVLGDQLVFEAREPALGLVFRYRWASCSAFGFVRTCELERLPDAAGPCSVSLLDGLLSIMPAGVPLATQQRTSSLVNAYRRSERLPDNPRLAIYALSALIVDRAEPAEALRANIVWSTGLEGAEVFLDGGQAERFLRREPLVAVDELRGRPGAYLLGANLSLAPGESTIWSVVADVHRSQAEVVGLLDAVGDPGVGETLRAAIEGDSRSLRAKLAAADALQSTGDATQDAHHLANVLFNCMRGGLFVDGYRAPVDDFRAFLRTRNARVADQHEGALSALGEHMDCPGYVLQALETGDPDLIRLALEYLPVTFSRRHGDPSRPWNRFSIRVRHPDGTPNLYYEGNWRDIFQNWEALLTSYPAFLPHVVAKFVNASTVDGFNPYRITRDGVDWEVPDPDDPWSYIGYWGDHQIVYLTRLLEAMEAHWPGALQTWLPAAVFSYADVPYRLKSHELIVENPRDTIEFDHERAARIGERVALLGTDGRLVMHRAHPDRVHHVTLAEKLLVPVLAKLGQLVVDGGVWMNTQRPEWNDANNALAGYGLSMVTLYQLRRHVALLEQLFQRAGDQKASLSAEVSAWMDAVAAILRDALPLVGTITATERRHLLDRLGRAFAEYRESVYEHGLGVVVPRSLSRMAELCRATLPVLDHAIRVQRRADGLYNAYNLLRISPRSESADVETMVEMLEGQVAVLGAGVLEPGDAVGVLDALWKSRLYREDQKSFLLYPDRPLPGFLEKNVVPAHRVAEDPLLVRILEASRRDIAERDGRGAVRFSADFRHAGDLDGALGVLAQDPAWGSEVERGREALLETFELTFHHHAFTGRSGTMFAYEGLGSIYWHMVSKLLLAVQENLVWATERGADDQTRAALLAHYRRIKGGLGPQKTPEEYGAFPTDPYSHTPRHAGAQQPGMTGQVKEEILTRRGELGLRVVAGQLSFGCGLLQREDFRAAALPSLEFTVAGVPVRYVLVEGQEPAIEVDVGGERRRIPGLTLDADLSRRVFLRDDAVRHIEVWLPALGQESRGERGAPASNPKGATLDKRGPP